MEINEEQNICLVPIEGVKAKLLSGEYTTFNKTGKSKVWQVFAGILNESGIEVESFVTCTKCKNVFKFNNKSTSNLLKHKCYVLFGSKKNYNTPQVEVDEKTRKESVCVATEWVVENCRSFKMIEDSGLKKFASFLISVGAKYGDNVKLESLIPHPTTLSRNVGKLYEKYFNEIKQELNVIKLIGYGITTDLWTDNYLKMSYLAVTIHYVKEGELKSRLLAMRSMEEEKSTGENIKLKVIRTLENFCCELSEKVIIVTDRGSNMISAFRSNSHIFCINHLLNNTVEKSIKETPDLAELCNKCIKLVKYFKKSGINSKLQSTLKSFSPTRWNTFFYLLRSVETNWNDIYSILREKNEMHRINNINFSSITNVLSILSSFEETSKKLEATNYPTLHWVYIYVHRLKKVCVINQDDINIVKAFKQKLTHFLNELVMKNININHKIAHFLFPPTNKLKQFTESDKIHIKDECKKLLKSYVENIIREGNVLPSTSKISPFNSELLTDFLQETTALNPADKIEQEMCLYENTEVIFYDDFDVLKWWNSHKADFPLLYKLSCKLLATPASSAASERTFSMARNLISEKRSAIGSNSDTVNKIMFLHSNMNKTNIYDEVEKIID